MFLGGGPPEGKDLLPLDNLVQEILSEKNVTLTGIKDAPNLYETSAPHKNRYVLLYTGFIVVQNSK